MNTQCKCGCGKDINPSLKTILIALESILGPLDITSGARCEERNKKVGGITNSSHIKGIAVDIGTPTSNYRCNLVTELVKLGIVRIGFARGFTHVDIDKSLPQRAFWLY